MRDINDTKLRESIEERRDSSGLIRTRMRILNASGRAPMTPSQLVVFPVDGESLMAGGR